MSVVVRSRATISYLVPDLTDPAVARRRSMLEAGGATVIAAGFHRRPVADENPGLIGMGQTADGDFSQRIQAVVRWLLKPRQLRRLVKDADVVIARNLEMLVLARVALFGRAKVPMHYECLDVHRLMLGDGLVSKGLRWLERLLLRRVSRVIVSSPAFERHYFQVHHPDRPDCLLVENRMLALDSPTSSPTRQSDDAPPWIIGWFGMIRCRRSLDILAAITAASAGRVQVVIRGRPSTAVFADLAQDVVALPGICFEGSYTAAELGSLYGSVHFVWAIDYFEEGLNSAWLLPNRLYEGGAFDRPVIAQAGVETARWLEERGSGLILTDPSELGARLQSLSWEAYQTMVAAARRITRSDLICDREDCRELVGNLTQSRVR